MEIIPLEVLMNAKAKSPVRRPDPAELPAPKPVKISAETHRWLSLVILDTGETLGEAAERFMLEGGLREAAQKVKA